MLLAFFICGIAFFQLSAIPSNRSVVQVTLRKLIVLATVINKYAESVRGDIPVEVNRARQYDNTQNSHSVLMKTDACAAGKHCHIRASCNHTKRN